MGALRLHTRLALRGAVRGPVDFLVSAVGLAVGSGVFVLCVALVTRVLAPALPFQSPGQVVAIRDAAVTASTGTLSSQQFHRLTGARTLAAIAAYLCAVRPVRSESADDEVRGCTVSPSLFEVLGVRPVVGSLPADGWPGPLPNSIIISHRLWKGLLGGNPDVIGRTLVVNGSPHQIVGVVPGAFFFPSPNDDFWIPDPFSYSPQVSWQFDVVARLRSGVTVAHATAELRSSGGAHSAGGAQLVVERFATTQRRAVKSLVWSLLLTGTLVLALSICNVSAMRWARSAQCEHTRVLQLAQGASCLQSIATELIELALVGAVATASSAIVVHGLLAVARRAVSPAPPVLKELTATSGDLLMAMLLSLVAAALAGALPIVRSLRTDSVSLTRSLSSASPHAVNGRATPRMRLVLAVQVAIAFALVAQTMLLGAGIGKVMRRDLGLEVGPVSVLRVRLPQPRYPTTQVEQNFFRNVLDGLDARGVEGAITNVLPLTEENRARSASNTEIETAFNRQPMPSFRIVSPAYFEVVEAELLEGRALGSDDTAAAPPVAVVSDTLARALFASRPYLGRRVRCAMRDWTVVGVTRATRHSVYADPQMEIFVPYQQIHQAAMSDNALSSMWIVARSARHSPRALAAVLQEVVRSTDPAVGASSPRRLQDYLWRSIGPRLFYAAAASALTVIALVLVTVALYSALQRTVSESVRETAIRVSLGGYGLRLVRDTLGPTLFATLAGCAGGAAVAMASAALLSRHFDGVTLPAGRLLMTVFLGASLFMLATLAVASNRAVRRVVLTRPGEALREY